MYTKSHLESNFWQFYSDDNTFKNNIFNSVLYSYRKASVYVGYDTII